MAWVSPETEEVSKKLVQLLESYKKKWWQFRNPIWGAFARAIIKSGINHATSVQPLESDTGEIIYGITICESDELYLVSQDNLPDIEPSPKYSEKLPLLMRIAFTYADILEENFHGHIFGDPECPSDAYRRLYKTDESDK